MIKRKIIYESNFPVGYPTGNDLYYECIFCGAVIPSFSNKIERCLCENIELDTYVGRLHVEDPHCFRILRADNDNLSPEVVANVLTKENYEIIPELQQCKESPEERIEYWRNQLGCQKYNELSITIENDLELISSNVDNVYGSLDVKIKYTNLLIRHDLVGSRLLQWSQALLEFIHGKYRWCVLQFGFNRLRIKEQQCLYLKSDIYGTLTIYNLIPVKRVAVRAQLKITDLFANSGSLDEV